MLRFLTCLYSSRSDHTCRYLFVRRHPVLHPLPTSSLPSIHLEFHSLDHRSVRDALRCLVGAADAVSARRSANRNHSACGDHVRSKSSGKILHCHCHVCTCHRNRGELFRTWHIRCKKQLRPLSCNYHAVVLLGAVRPP